MSAKRYSLAEASDHLAELIEAAQSGDEVIIDVEGKARVRLSVVRSSGGKRVFGQHRGKIRLHDDFDQPLPESFWLGEEA